MKMPPRQGSRRSSVEPLEARRLLAATPTPFLGHPFNIATDTINAVNFDNGGEGVSFHDTTPQNIGGAYRSTAVDIGAEASASNGFFLGWTAPGEWLDYTISAASAGTYALQARVASHMQGGTFHMEIDGTNVTGPMTIPDTGPWDTWAVLSSPSFTLAAGTHVMRIVEDQGGYWGTIGDFDTFSFAPRTQPPTGPTPFLGQPFNVSTDTIYADDFDNGGEGISFHDTTPQNLGGQYRNTAVDINKGGANGFSVGYTAPGEWLDYTINVTAAGTYVFQARVASHMQGGTFHMEIGGQNLTGTMTVPDSGPWDTWTTVVSQPFTLPAGTQVMRVVMDRGGYWGAIGDFDTFRFSPVTQPPPPSTLPQLQWQAAANSPVARLEASAVTVGGKMYVFGGYDQDNPNWLASKETDAFDPASNTWTRLADIPEGLTHIGAATDGRYIYAAGGYVSNYVSGQQTFATSDVWRYDTQTNQWTAFVSLPQPRAAGGLVLLGSQLHYIEGTDQNRAARTDHWALDLTAASPQWIASTPLPFSRNHITANVLNGKIYAIGGQPLNDDAAPAADLLMWDPTNPSGWQTLANLPQPRSHAVSDVIDGQIVVADGAGPGEVILNSVVAYNPLTNAWSTLLDPVPEARLNPAGALVDGRLVITTGWWSGLRSETWMTQVLS